jgi:hypothetical protein
MTALNTTYPSSASAPTASPLPLLREVPKLLEYRADADPDAEFIPKTVAGFALGGVAMCICLELAKAVFFQFTRHTPVATQLPTLVQNVAFMLGITFVGCSLLLVGLKVRADHTDAQLYARHWLNSIGTGAVYSIMIWAPWQVMAPGAHINRFVAAAILMLLLAFPAVAAKWTIAPHPEPAH